MKYGLAILTYTKDNSPNYQMRLVDSLRTLQNSGYDGEYFIVDDGSVNRNWRWVEDELGFLPTIIKRKLNGGVSRGKNTCIRLLLEHGIDVGFLADDDISYKVGWWKPYLKAHAESDVQHFSWTLPKMRACTVNHNGFPVTRCTGLNGVLLTFTPQVIEDVGGFPVTRLKWGYDHVNWTNRIIEAGLSPFFADVVEGLDCIELGPFSQFSPVGYGQRREMHKYTFAKIGSIFQELVE